MQRIDFIVRDVNSACIHVIAAILHSRERMEDVMIERRDFLKITFGCVAGAVAFAASVKAAPLALHGLRVSPVPDNNAQPALAAQDDLERAKVEEVRWHGHHGHWGHHHWGHRHRGHRHWGWHNRHWGWRRRHWYHRHYWGGYRRCWRDRWGY